MVSVGCVDLAGDALADIPAGIRNRPEYDVKRER